MNQFCHMKGIKREFSVARTPQQNGVAERKNRTLIEAARTMLADSLLPNLDFMRPFGCPVTILNTLDHLGKFEGKADEGFLVGYSVNRSGPEWLFDIDSLTKSMNYEPVTAGNQTNDDVGKGDDGVCQGSGIDDKERTNSSTQDVNTARLSINTTNANINTSSLNINTASPIPNNPSMIPLKETGIFNDAYDDREVGVKVDLNNLETAMNVWTLVDLPKGKRAIGTKWVFRNKKDKRCIVVRNKARLVTQGYTKEERIDYDEVYAPVARIEAIMLFLAYASFIGFIVYQMNVKSAFLYGTIKEEVSWYKTLSTDLLENGFRRGTIDKTLFIKKERGDILLVMVYVDDIIFGFTKKYNKRRMKSSSAKTTFRPNIMFAVCAFGRFQVTPKTLNLYAMKRIFRYIKGQLKLGLWYPRDSPFDLEAFFDSDYAGSSLDKKSTTRGCQFLRRRLISWQCKKQTIVANSTTEAEYVAAANCCGQVISISDCKYWNA
ncbi:retrovirus-related pol polyprotein from transposon TNT 1-94 [Tanacetum coccineum]|uniref:Retrovirus-related pol polyprotein from transposon TNT 1-94 n=1 Tax=Tanacetum coccineum TaxID=301880 RepID=A0ABQ5DAX9_9ASTR